MASELDGVRPGSVLRNNTSVNSGAEEQIADQGKKKKKKKEMHSSENKNDNNNNNTIFC